MDNAKSLQRSSVIENRKSYIMSANQDKEKEEVLLKLMLPILCSYFVNKGNLKGLKTLFESHNCVEIMDYDMRTPLHIASANGNADIVTFLLSKGSNPNITDRWGKTPLWEALINNHIEIAKQLNLYGAILCRDNFVIGSEIFRFVLRNYLYHLNLFLRFGSANLVNIQDYDGRTPLHVAVYLENVPLIRMLIDLGADLNCRDRWKKSVLDYARESKSESVLRACTT
jgi:ankyrin repeat protein